MASKSVTTAARLTDEEVKEIDRTGFVGSIDLWVGTSVLSLGVPNDAWELERFRRVACRLSEMAAATLLCAHARGDDDSDPVGTYEDANEAAQILLRLSIGLLSSVDSLEAYESALAHGKAKEACHA